MLHSKPHASHKIVNHSPLGIRFNSDSTCGGNSYGWCIIVRFFLNSCYPKWYVYSWLSSTKSGFSDRQNTSSKIMPSYEHDARVNTQHFLFMWPIEASKEPYSLTNTHYALLSKHHPSPISCIIAVQTGVTGATDIWMELVRRSSLIEWARDYKVGYSLFLSGVEMERGRICTLKRDKTLTFNSFQLIYKYMLYIYIYMYMPSNKKCPSLSIAM